MNTRKVCAIAPCTSRKAYVAPIAPAGEDEMPHTKGAKDTKVAGFSFLRCDSSWLWCEARFLSRFVGERDHTNSDPVGPIRHSCSNKGWCPGARRRD